MRIKQEVERVSGVCGCVRWGGGGVRGWRGEKAGVKRRVSGVRWLRGKVRRV